MIEIDEITIQESVNHYEANDLDVKNEIDEIVALNGQYAVDVR